MPLTDAELRGGSIAGLELAKRDALPKDLSGFLGDLTSPTPPPPPFDPHARAAIPKARFVAEVRSLYPDASEFSDEDIAGYSLYYTGRTVAFQLRQVGRHLRDRLDKRAVGKAHEDDPNGLALEVADG
jgi:hypothetical protein